MGFTAEPRAGDMEIEEFNDAIRACVREVLAEVIPAINAHVTETVVQSAREAARCALCDEIDYIVDKGHELYTQAAGLKRSPSTFKGQ